MQVLFRLSRCPVCKKNASSSLGCCKKCALKVFKPYVTGNTLVLGKYSELGGTIRAFKYHHVTRLAGLFARAFARELQKHSWKTDSVTSVPLHWRKKLTRGYNQSALVAKELAKILKKPYQTLLTRTRFTEQQAKLSKEKRLQNVLGAFSAKKVTSEHIVLIDDVITTGATIGVCCEVLLKAGAKKVYLLAIAKA